MAKTSAVDMIMFPSIVIIGIAAFLMIFYGAYEAGRVDGHNAQYNVWRNALIDSPESIATIRSEVLLEREIQRLKETRK